VNARNCINEDHLIDYVDHDVTEEERIRIEKHLAECRSCAAYVESLNRAFDAVSADKVPEPGPAYWAYFAANVTNRAAARAESRKKRFRLALIPGVAAAAACVLIIMLFTRVSIEPVGDVDGIIADLNTSVVTEEILFESGMDELFLGQIGSDAGLLDTYLIETGEVGEMVGELSEDEERDLINKLNSLMELRGSIDNGVRKGCSI
jgi:hypothetical protein